MVVARVGRKEGSSNFLFSSKWSGEVSGLQGWRWQHAMSSSETKMLALFFLFPHLQFRRTNAIF